MSMKKRLVWPGLPLLLLASIVIVDVTMVVVASLNPPVIVDEHPVAPPAMVTPATIAEQRE